MAGRTPGSASHEPESELLRRSLAFLEEREVERRRLRIERRRRQLRDVLRGIALVLVTAVAAAVAGTVADGLGSGASRHAREILWWLTLYGVTCGGATYGLFSEYFGQWEGVADARRYAPMAAVLVPGVGAGILVLALLVDAFGRAVARSIGLFS